MNIRFKNRIFHTISLILVLLIIVLMANSFSNFTHSLVDNTQNNIIRKILNANDVKDVIAFNEKTINVAQKYSLALLETSITLNEFPNLDTRIFSIIIATIPQSTIIENFTFYDEKIIVECFSENFSDCTIFSNGLLNEEYFTKVTETVPVKTKDGYNFIVTLYI